MIRVSVGVLAAGVTRLGAAGLHRNRLRRRWGWGGCRPCLAARLTGLAAFVGECLRGVWQIVPIDAGRLQEDKPVGTEARAKCWQQLGRVRYAVRPGPGRLLRWEVPT